MAIGHENIEKKTVRIIKSKLYPRLFFLGLLVAILVLGFYITRPFLPALLTGAIIAYLCYPFYCKSLNYIKNKNAAAFTVSIIIVLLFTVPFIIILGLVSQEAYYTYTTLNQHNLGTNFMKIVCKNEDWLSCRSMRSVVSLLPEGDLDYYLQVSIEKITKFIVDNFSSFLVSLPSIMLNFFIMIFVVYYLLKDGGQVSERIKNLLPLKEPHKQKVLARFHDLTFGSFYGSILMAVLQGVLGGIGFLVLGVPSALLWGFVMIFFALVPYFGTAIIWLPAALNLIFQGYLQNDTSITVRGVVLIIYGLLVVSTIDNFLKPKLIGSKTKVHPIVVLLGVLGGLKLFGFIGIILGPVMLALLMTFIEIYETEKGEMEKYV